MKIKVKKVNDLSVGVHFFPFGKIKTKKDKKNSGVFSRLMIFVEKERQQKQGVVFQKNKKCKGYGSGTDIVLWE